MSILRNINYIARAEAMPCAQPDPLIWIQTGLQSAGPALLQLFVPGCGEILQARLGINPTDSNPIGGLLKGSVDGRARRGGRHGKVVKARIESMTRPTPVGGRQFLYRAGFFAIQRALWWWMVADVTTEFIARWESLIRETSGCDIPGTGWVSTGIAPLYFTGPGEGTLTFGSVAKSCADIRLQRIRVLPGTKGAIGWHMEWEKHPASPFPMTGITTWLEQVSTGKKTNVATINDPVQGNGIRTGGFHTSNNIAGIVSDEYRIRFNFPNAVTARPVLGQVSVQCSGVSTSQSWGCRPDSTNLL